MKLNDKVLQRLVQYVFRELKTNQTIIFKEKEEAVAQRAVEILREETRKEMALDQEVNRMMDDLERQNPGEFQRYKMFPMLKKRLAKERGIIL
jgi:hypothetical protein